MENYIVGEMVILSGRKYRVCSLTALDNVYCLETAGGWFHAHASILRRAE